MRNQEKEHLSAIIKQIKASGAVVALPDGSSGWLPGYEIYPDFRPHEDFRIRARDRLKPGDNLAVVVFDTERIARNRNRAQIADPRTSVAVRQRRK